MNQILLEVDDQTLARLEAVAPARSRQRAKFLRAAIQKALWDLEEVNTRAAYLAKPDIAPEAFDATVWEPASPTPKPRAKNKSKRKANP